VGLVVGLVLAFTLVLVYLNAPFFNTRNSSTTIVFPSIQVSRNARCGYSRGAKDGFTCKGSAYGDCCSQYSYR
jgi:hypothetical protein